jgi:hypothetical protein
MQRPEPTEYNPYFENYIKLVPEGNFKELIAGNTLELIHQMENIHAGKAQYSYAEGKWSVKEVYMHLIDVERVMSYRALVCARGDKSPLPTMDDQLYLTNSNVSDKSLRDLVDEFVVVRNATNKLFDYVSDQQSRFVGSAGGFPITARALGYIIIGHVMHHMNVIQEKYLS